MRGIARNPRRRMVLAGLLALLSLAAVGCGEQGPRTIPVRGKVTFAGGPCPASGQVRFLPISAPSGNVLHVGDADFGTDGAFQVKSFKPGDGLVPGTYVVRVVCWKNLPTELAPGVSYMPENFTVPDLTVAEDARGPVEVTIDVK